MKTTRRSRASRSSADGVEGGAAVTAAPTTAARATPAAEVRYAIGELAKELDVTTRTIRFYEAKGLLAPERKGVARIYSRRDRARLILILRGTNLGFSLEDIKAYLELYDADPTHLSQLKMLETKLDEHIDALKSKRADLDRMLKELGEIRSQTAALVADLEKKAT